MEAPGTITNTNTKGSGDGELAGASAKEPGGAAYSGQPPGHRIGHGRSESPSRGQTENNQHRI